ncbi:hypothetical protein BsWGS_01193 [Bradybaena similaris]
MLKTISDKLLSLWPYHTNNTDKVSVGCKRKRNNDECDTDLPGGSVEKKRKTEVPNSFVGSIKESFSNMTLWLNSKSKRFSEEFHIIPSKRESVPTSFNGGSIKIPQPVSNRNSTHHEFAIHHHEPHKVVVGNGTIGDEPKNTFSLNASRSSACHHRPSTAAMCVRLKEKEEFKKLLQLQSQRSPWQQPVSFGIPNTSSNGNDSDIISVSSESKNPRSHQMEVKPGQAIFNIPKHKVTPNNINSDYVSQSLAKSIQTKKLLNTLHEREQRYCMGSLFRKPPVHHDQNFLASCSKDSSHHQVQTNTGRDIGPPSKQPEAFLIIDDDDEDDCQPTAAKSTSATKSPAATKESQTQKPDFRTQVSFLQSRFMNDREIEDEQRARLEEQKRRKLLIEEEEMKARAYEKKRRAQEISLDRSLKYQMRIFDDEPQVCEEIFREEEAEEEDKLPELTSEMQVVIDKALRPGPAGEVLSEDFRLQITRRDIATLSGLNWLNDEVINFYMNLLMRSGEQGERAKLYAFNTFFYPKIKTGGHSAVRRWTKSVDIFAVHYVVIPVHLGVHWCLCIADMEKKVITYYDSMGASNNQCLYAVLQYLHDESVAKNHTAFKRNEWQLMNAEDNPQQMNGGDCGMFMCMYAEFITRGKEITFTQEHMPYFRRRMVYEIISRKLLH